ncbi:deoxycytidyl transferase [Lithohypha guttulata]|uniref:deoxycytidyl transferase n=1 Tax=Lithohypha guttulata TaxID=1690604 RepID=UPI002DDDF9C7|nr:deoxycytidyl transferase [Lithohypha guttulata]
MGSRLEKNSNSVRKRIAEHTFDGEDGEEYAASKFGGFTDYMRRKKLKLQNLDANLRSQSDKPQIFRSIVVHVNGYTQPSLQDLHVLVVTHGGGFQQYLEGKTAVTHIVASELTPKKKVEFAKYRCVAPAWIVDSVAAGKLLPWNSYRIVDEGETQKVLRFQGGQMTAEINKRNEGYKAASESSWYVSQVKHVADKINASPRTTGLLGIQDSDSLSHDVPEAVTNISFDEAAEPEDESDELLLQLAATQNSLTSDTPPTVEDKDAVNHPHPNASIDHNPHPEPQADSPFKGEERQLTAEEHNAILLQNPHMAKSSTANPDFLNQYYRESRLHHLSTWKAELKAQLQARAQERSSQRQRHKRPLGSRRYVMHVDFDSFFAAVSLRKHPQWKDKPVVIAHGSGPGSEIASCNYPARSHGIKNGMWMKYALDLYPHLKVLPYDYKAYEEASKLFYDSILAIEGIAQSISIDEALIDISDLCIRAGGSDGKDISEGSIYREQIKANELATALRDDVRNKTGCEVSVGIGSNILLAKIALRKAKPAGQHLIMPEDVLDFIGELLVTDLPGVAHSTGNKLEVIGVKYAKDIRTVTKEKLINTLGPKTGEKIWDYSRGIDRQEVGDQVVRKSVSAEINWGIRFVNQQQAEEFVYCLCEELSKRLLEQVVKGKQLTMKIMRKAADAGLDPPKNLGHGKCDTFNKAITLGVATNDKTVIGKEAVSVLRSYNFPPGELRGLGVQMQKLEPLKPTLDNVGASSKSSQRQLQFKRPETISRISEGRSPISATKPTMTASRSSPISETSVKIRKHHDPIEELPTPEKPSLAAQNELAHLEDNDQTPLNISGTQFVLPSQIDPDVLAALPADIRARLAPKTAKLFEAKHKDDTISEGSRSRSQSPFISDSEVLLPSESQLDPEVLAALPEDMREELLAEQRRAKRSLVGRKTQQVLPQSPRKAKPYTTRVNVTPKKKHKTTTLFPKFKARDPSVPTLTQANFVSRRDNGGIAEAQTLILDEDIPEDLLDELPEQIRLEILAEQKRQRLQQRSNLDVPNRRRNKIRKGPDEDVDPSQRRLHFAAPKPRPTFTDRKLSTLPELRDIMSSWVRSCSSGVEGEPEQEDTHALGTYLARVVLEEGDMAKAQSLVEWLEYVVQDAFLEDTPSLPVWTKTIAFLKAEVQGAVRERGLQPLRFR